MKCNPLLNRSQLEVKPGPESIHLYANTSREKDGVLSVDMVSTTRERLAELNKLAFGPHTPEPDVHRIRGEFPEDSKRYRVVDLNYYVSW